MQRTKYKFNVSNFYLELRTALYMENLFILHKALLCQIVNTFRL